MNFEGAAMLRVEKVACDDFRDVEDLLTNFWRKGNEVKWHKLFEYQWGRDENYCGSALKDLDAKGRILLPIGRRLFQPKYTPPRMTHDLAIIERKLDGQNRKIFHDHKPYPCSHFLATETDCYFLYIG